MTTPPGPHDEEGHGRGDDWGAPPPPPQQPPPPDDAWGRTGRTPDQPDQTWGQAPPPAQGQEGWAQPGAPGYGAAPQTNGMAIGALIASILGFFCGVGFIIGLILGYNARNQIRSSGGRQSGEGLATGAIVVGWIGIGLMALGILFFGFIVMLGTTGGM